MKPHEFRELVNDLRDIAERFHSSQQLRERIAGRLRESLLPSGAPDETKVIGIAFDTVTCTIDKDAATSTLEFSHDGEPVRTLSARTEGFEAGLSVRWTNCPGKLRLNLL